MMAVMFVIGALGYMGYEKGWFEAETIYRIELPSDGSTGFEEGERCRSLWRGESRMMFLRC